MRFCFLVWLCTTTSFAANPTRPTVHVRNFGVVNDHLLRGAQPSASEITELSLAGAKLIIDLREAGTATAIEKQEVEKLGMKYTNIPFPPLAAPSPALIRNVLNLITENKSQTIFVHCRRGKDRTGTVVACYRIQHDGWDNQHALEEANEFGMSALEHGMRSFIVHFTPVTNASDPILLTH